jgi:tetratricopeptide (TPR) repeat protein
MPAPVRAVFVTLVLSALAHAQRPSPLDPDQFGVVYDVPGTADVRVESNVTYWRSGGRELQLDLYLPPGKASGPRPAVVFVNGVGDQLPDRVKEWGIYRTWPRLVAAHGLVGIGMDCDGEHVPESIAAVFTFLAREGAAHGVDATRLGVYASSANSGAAVRYLMGPECSPGIRCAAFFYGWPEAPELRRDLPVLCIVAEGDAARGSELYERLWPQILAARAPWTMQYASGLPHAFDAFSDSDASRRVIQQALAFWKSHLEPVPQPPWKPTEERALVEASYWGDTTRLVDALGAWIAKHPDEPAGYEMRGMQLARAQRGREAKPDLEKALALGSTEVGVKGCLGMVLAGEGKHAEAVALLEVAVAGGWRSSQTMGMLGHSLLVLGRNEEAVRAYESALEMGVPPGASTLGLASYNLACGYARLGRVEEALTCIERAVEQRFGSRAGYEGDADFARLREEERFLIAMDRLGAPR